MNLHAVVENENANWGFDVQRTVYKRIDHILGQALVGYFQLAKRIKLFLNLYFPKITGKEIHDSVEPYSQQASAKLRNISEELFDMG